MYVSTCTHVQTHTHAHTHMHVRMQVFELHWLCTYIWYNRNVVVICNAYVHAKLSLVCVRTSVCTCSHIVATLKQGQAVRAEQFDEVTVCFSAITDFPEIASQSTPIEVGIYIASWIWLCIYFNDCLYHVAIPKTTSNNYADSQFPEQALCCLWLNHWEDECVQSE